MSKRCTKYQQRHDKYCIQQYLNMNLLVLILSLLVLTKVSQGQQMEIDLQSTQAILYTNNKILLKFKVKGANVPYSISYNGIPSDWSNLRNDLVVSNVTQHQVQEWTFDINLTDSLRNNLYQTVKLSLNKYQVMLFPVTLAFTQRLSPSSLKSQAAPAPTLFNLTDLINRYPGLRQNASAFNINYNSNSIITPQLIANAQATYNPARDSRPITEFDIKKNAAINRQLNAAKAIANLLTIIDRLNMSINTEQSNLQNLQKEVKAGKEAVFNCSEQVFKIKDTQAKINNALNDRNTRLNQEKQLSDASLARLSQLKINQSLVQAKIRQIQKTIDPGVGDLNQLQVKSSSCKNQQKSFSASIDILSGKIKSNNLQINSIKDDIADSNRRLSDVNDSLGIVRVKITDLKKQIKQAEDQEQSLLKDQNYYLTIPIQGKTKIGNLENKNKEFQNQILQLNIQNRKSIEQCQQQEKASLAIKQAISKKQNNYNQLQSQINSIKKNIQSVESQIKQFSANSNNLNVEIRALNLELSKYSPRLIQQNYLCSVAEEQQHKKQAKISQSSQKISRDSVDLSNANRNLERARAQKELADQGVQQFISVISNVPPYSIIPNGGSTILGGSPLGNNPSGSSLGPAFRVDTIEKGSLDISNMTTYLSTAYGMNIDPINMLKALSDQQKQRLSQNNTSTNYSALYPLDIESRNQIVSPLSVMTGLSNFNCQGSPGGSLQTISAILEQATLGSLIVRDILNKKYTLSLSSCTKILSTKPSDFFKTGTKIYFTGTEMYNLFGNTLFNAYTILSIPV